MPNFISKKLFVDGRTTHGRTDERTFETGFIRSTLSNKQTHAHALAHTQTYSLQYFASRNSSRYIMPIWQPETLLVAVKLSNVDCLYVKSRNNWPV